MAVPSNGELVRRWQNEPAPLLPMLHAFHDRDGFISDEAVRRVSEALKIPLAELFGTVSFYHHFSRRPPGQKAPRVCMGPVSRLKGGQDIPEGLREEGATPMACPGRCDDPVPVIKGHMMLAGKSVDTLAQRPYPLPAPNPGGFEECVLAHIREPGRATIEGDRQTGGYEGLTRAVREMSRRT